jgi:hypothetical protein
MKYGIDYQYLPKGAQRPLDDGEVVGIEATDERGAVVLPNVGDYVEIQNAAEEVQRSSFSGKVRSKLFRYVRIPNGEIFCQVNIVVEETQDDWGLLVKE